ncbi:hypothetical protein BGZ57DRAFT_890034 [Hyaloscypha finlandica]|nr:hypothetical protein BGZ57DRAFT_890034 [Hyaloscypha finlandica]
MPFINILLSFSTSTTSHLLINPNPLATQSTTPLQFHPRVDMLCATCKKIAARACSRCQDCPALKYDDPIVHYCCDKWYIHSPVQTLRHLTYPSKKRGGRSRPSLCEMLSPSRSPKTLPGLCHGSEAVLRLSRIDVRENESEGSRENRRYSGSSR